MKQIQARDFSESISSEAIYFFKMETLRNPKFPWLVRVALFWNSLFSLVCYSNVSLRQDTLNLK